MKKKGQAINWKVGIGGGLIILGIYLLSLGGVPNSIGGVIAIAIGLAFITGRA